MNNNYCAYFAVAIKEVLAEMAQMDCAVHISEEQSSSFLSQGMAVVIGITGKRPGRIIIDTDRDTAIQLTQAMNGEEDVDEELIMETMCELANTVSGHVISLANNENKGLNLMLTPPSIFCGLKLSIVSPKINAKMIKVQLGVDQLLISIGFEGGR